jgi:hypothetical protein
VEAVKAGIRVLGVSRMQSLPCIPKLPSNAVKAITTSLGLASFPWRAIVSSVVTTFLLSAILLEVIATTVEALDISRNRPLLSSTQRS